jgi:hypothetical protein
MSAEAVPETKRRFRAGGCLLRIAIVAAVLIGIVIAIGTIFNEGDDADQPVHGFIAGNVTSFPPGSVNYFEAQHFFLTNVPDVGFVARYDRSSRQQELNGDCRVHYEDTAGTGTLPPLAGTTGALVEDCNNGRAVWRVDGTFAFGNSYGDLDRFDVRVTQPAGVHGDVIVDLESRSCTRSRGVIGIPPFDVRRCGKGD